MSPFTLRSRWIVPVDRPPIAGGYVGVAEGRVAAIGASDPGCGPVRDLGDCAVLPGLVNAHTHLEFSSLVRPLGTPGMSLPSWIRQVIGERKRGDRDAATTIALGLRESLQHGVTTIGEIATAPHSSYPTGDGWPAIVQFQEAIGFSAGRIDSVFADVERRFAAGPSPPLVGLSPHAPYTVHPTLVERVVQLAARSGGAAVAMHLAESREELQLLADGGGEFRDLLQERSMWDAAAIPPGARAMDYLRLLAQAPRSLVIHGNYLAAEEIAFIGERRERMSVVFCPRTHAYFQHEGYPLEAMLAHGVRVALGTDSRASNPDLSILGEVRHAARQFSTVGAEALLRMATLHGAEALGLAGQAGSITPDKRADLIALPCGRSLGDPYETIVEGGEQPGQVWLGGNAALEKDLAEGPDSSLRSE